MFMTFISPKFDFLANSAGPDEMPHHHAAFYLGIHCLPSTRLGISGPQRVNSLLILKNFHIHFQWMEYGHNGRVMEHAQSRVVLVLLNGHVLVCTLSPLHQKGRTVQDQQLNRRAVILLIVQV